MELNEGFARRYWQLAQEIFEAVAEGHLSQNSPICKALVAGMPHLAGHGLESRPVHSPKRSYGGQRQGLEDVIAVARAIRSKSKTFASACEKQASRRHVEPPTVRDACCRRLGLDAQVWNDAAMGITSARRQIVGTVESLYPRAAKEIQEAFGLQQ